LGTWSRRSCRPSPTLPDSRRSCSRHAACSCSGSCGRQTQNADNDHGPDSRVYRNQHACAVTRHAWDAEGWQASWWGSLGRGFEPGVGRLLFAALLATSASGQRWDDLGELAGGHGATAAPCTYRCELPDVFLQLHRVSYRERHSLTCSRAFCHSDTKITELCDAVEILAGLTGGHRATAAPCLLVQCSECHAWFGGQGHLVSVLTWDISKQRTRRSMR
jgi:hypothetical protein